MSQLTCSLCHQDVDTTLGELENELVPGPDGRLVRRVYHSKRCWPLERRRRKRELRQAVIGKELDEQDKKAMSAPVQPPAEPPPIEYRKYQRRGLGDAAHRILDAIPVGQEWTIPELRAALETEGLPTTTGTIHQLVYTYRQYRRQTETVRFKQGTKGGNVKVFAFTGPPHSEAPTYTSAIPAERRRRGAAAREEPQSAELNRAFNDFQASMLETLMDFKNQLSKLVGGEEWQRRR
jgi:hypothetical protein